jgi:DNA-binding NarL/FixJ family response regulator
MRFLVADDHPIYLEAVHERLVRLFPGSVIDVAITLKETLAALNGSSRYEFVLMDYAMPGCAGIGTVRAVVRAAKTIPVIIMSGIAVDAEAVACIRVGARGFFPKTMGIEIFASAVRVVLAGGTYLPAEILAMRGNSGPVGAVDIDDRDRQIIQLVVAGKTNKDIALTLDLAVITVKGLTARLYKKFGARNRAHFATLIARGPMEAKP